MGDARRPDLLRGRGLRLTPQRLVVREVLQQSAGHLSAQDVHAAVRTRLPGVDLSTIYRVLELFVRLGLVAKRDFGDERAVYEWCPEQLAHDHLVCMRCGGVTHFGNTQVVALIRDECAAVGFIPRKIELNVLGLCHRCQNHVP